MSKNPYIRRIQNELNKPYEIYCELFKEYVDYLKNIVSENPNNCIAVNQLAIALLEIRDYDSALATIKNEAGCEPTIQTLNNLAYFYLREEHEPEKAIHELVKVIQMNPQSPIPFNLLGEAYLALDNANDALSPLKKAVELQELTEYLNNYGVALFRTGNLSKASECFRKASKNWETNYNALVSYYHYGVCEGLLGNYRDSLEVAKSLTSLLDSSDDFIDRSQIADIFYVCGKFDQVVSMYRNSKLWYSPDWVALYLYSLYKLGQNDDMLLVLSNATSEKNNLLKEIDDEESSDYKAEIITEIEEYQSLYTQIVENNHTPKLTFIPSTLFRCDLFGCIRHNVPNYLSNIDDI